MNQTDPRGRFVWYELLTTDPGAAQDFYTSVIGWGTSQWEDGDTPYTMWMNGDVPIGGIMQLPEEAAAAGASPHWLPYIAAPDVDGTVDRAKDLGAQIMVKPTDIPTVGRFAVLADPQGALFAVFAAEGEHPGHEGAPRSGEFSWHELATSDYEGAFDFYSELFGWKKAEATDMGAGLVYQMFARRDLPLGGMFNKPAEMAAPSHWLCYAMVDDVHEAVNRVNEHGGEVLNGPMEVPGGDWIAQCMDPQGALFAIHASRSSDVG